MFRLAVGAPVATKDVAQHASGHDLYNFCRCDDRGAADEDGRHRWLLDYRKRVGPDGWKLGVIVQRGATLAAEVVAYRARGITALARVRFQRGGTFLVHGWPL